MKRGLLIFTVIALSMLAVSPVLAHEDMSCAHDVATIAALRECVVHAREMGHIDSDQIAQNLLKKLDKAQASLDNDKVNNAIGLLQGFIEAVEEQSGENIDPGGFASLEVRFDDEQWMVGYLPQEIAALARRKTS